MNGCFPGAFGNVCDWRSVFGHVGSRDDIGFYGQRKKRRQIINRSSKSNIKKT